MTLTLVLGVLAGTAPVFARAQALPSPGLLRTHFSSDAGLPGSVVDKIVQTPDGFLWLIIGEISLVRFDGKRFHPFRNIRPFTVLPAPEGGLWVGTRQGIIRVPESSLHRFELTQSPIYHPTPEKPSDVICVRLARGGGLWIGTTAGLFRFDGQRSVPIGPRVEILTMDEAPDGHLWFVTPDTVMEVAGADVIAHPTLHGRLGVGGRGLFHLMTDRRGSRWYSSTMGIARESGGHLERLDTYGARGHGAFLSYEDAQGTVWIGKEEGLFRAGAGGLELVAPGLKIRSLDSDRDGNLWVGTNGDGLHRFSTPPVRMFAGSDGLPNSPIMTVMTTRDGTTWSGANCGGVSRFDGTRFQTFDERHGLVNSCVYAMAEDTDGDLWIGTWGGGAFRFRDGQFTQLAKKDGMPHDRVSSVVAARDGAVWFGTGGGVVRLKDGRLRTFTTSDGLSRNAIYRIFEDRAGVIWATGRDGVDRLVGERFQHYTGVPNWLIVPFGEDRDGGLFLQDLVKSVTLRVAGGRSDSFTEFRSPQYLVETEEGELWLGGESVVRVPPGQFRDSRRRDEPFDYETFSTADGLATAELGVAGQRTLALAPDGSLWAATLKGVARFDRRRLALTTVKPLIYLTDITIGRTTSRADGDVVLPPGTSHLRIDFSAVELSSPEKIRMQYRLDGVDSEWLDAGRDPHATYSSLRAGTHTLRIRASNRSGVWDRQGVTFTIRQLPFFYQTRWFAAAMVVLGVVLVGLTYRLRVRQISRAMNARFDERLAERTRVARELHDTFLQTVQGSKLVADHALKDPADRARMVRAMEQLSTWLERATEEGRAALNSLRASTTEKNDLAEAFRRAIDECRGLSRAEASFTVSGDAREMHPIVRDEVYRIGYEAIRNACVHSGAADVTVHVEYAHDLTLRVSDNGVGIDAEIAEHGKDGHFGLPGMRERARRIGAKFTLSSAPGAGASVTLIVPGRTAFAVPHHDVDPRPA